MTGVKKEEKGEVVVLQVFHWGYLGGVSSISTSSQDISSIILVIYYFGCDHAGLLI